MKASTTAGAFVLTAVGCFASPAYADRSLEVSIETGSTLVQLPSGGQDAVTVRSCASCSSQLVRLTANSRFESMGQALSLEKLRALFASGNYNVLVTLTPGTTQVRRIVITGAAGGQ